VSCSDSSRFGPSTRLQGGDETGSVLTPTSLLETLRQMRSRHVL
jgi:hypothetical protein